jgi:hypothetical protein
LYFSGIAFSVDTDLNEDEKTFESEFHKIYFNPADEKAAGTYLYNLPLIYARPVGRPPNQSIEASLYLCILKANLNLIITTISFIHFSSTL